MTAAPIHVTTLIVGSGFTTHNLRWFNPGAPSDAPAPTPSVEFDHWAEEAMAAKDVDALLEPLPTTQQRRGAA